MNPELTPLSCVRNAGSPLIFGIDQQRDAPLGDRADLHTRERENVRREGNGLGVKVAAGEHFVGARENQRIVGDRIGLGNEGGRRLRHEIEASAHHLRLAAQRVGVLYPLARSVRFADLAPGEQFAIGRSDSCLPIVAAKLVDPRIERHIATLKRIERDRAAHHRGAKHRLELEQSCECQRGRHLGAVQKRQSFLGPELDGRDTRLRQALPPRDGSHRRASGCCRARALAVTGGPAARGLPEAPTEPCAGTQG